MTGLQVSNTLCICQWNNLPLYPGFPSCLITLELEGKPGMILHVRQWCDICTQ